MASATPSERLLSLDVSRGSTIAGMMMVDNQGGHETYLQLEHASWHGWTYFLHFMWFADVAVTLSTAGRGWRPSFPSTPRWIPTDANGFCYPPCF